jgi:predicted nucleic acid-binding protein
MSGPLAFFDSSIFVYTDDRSSPEKQEQAIALFSAHLRDSTAVVSLQVLQEYFAASTRKLKVPADKAQRKVEIMARCRVVRLEPTDVLRAIELHRLSHVSFWDALIVQAARLSGAATLYSEDMQADSIVGGVKVINPFARPDAKK